MSVLNKIKTVGTIASLTLMSMGKLKAQSTHQIGDIFSAGKKIDRKSPKLPEYAVRLDTVIDGTHYMNPDYLDQLSDQIYKNLTIVTNDEYDHYVKLGYDMALEDRYTDTDDRTLAKKLNIDEKIEKLAQESGTDLHDRERIYAREIVEEVYTLPYINNEDTKYIGDYSRDILGGNYQVCQHKAYIAHVYLKKLGIKHWVAMLPDHVALVVHISDQDRYMDPTHMLVEPIDIFNAPKQGVYCNVGKFDGDYTYRIYTMDPTQAFLSMNYHNRGLAYSKLEDYEKAIADYTKAIELAPNDVSAYHNRGLAYSKLEDYEKAIADYTKAIELDPNDVSAYYNRGLAYNKLEDYERSRIFFYVILGSLCVSLLGVVLDRLGKSRDVLSEANSDTGDIISQISGDDKTHLE